MGWRRRRRSMVRDGSRGGGGRASVGRGSGQSVGRSGCERFKRTRCEDDSMRQQLVLYGRCRQTGLVASQRGTREGAEGRVARQRGLTGLPTLAEGGRSRKTWDIYVAILSGVRVSLREESKGFLKVSVVRGRAAAKGRVSEEAGRRAATSKLRPLPLLSPLIPRQFAGSR